MSFLRNLFAPVALLAALSGCSTTPRFNSHFGEAVRANLAAQVLDPAAAANTNPVTGVDGVAANAAHERYQRSFSGQTNEKPPLVVVNGAGAR
jgi:hypothetical protein